MWFCFLSHLVGLRFGKWTENIGGAATYVCIVALAVAGLAVALRGGSTTHFDLVPVVSWNNLNLWSQIAFALVGLELAPILGGEIVDPLRTVPRAAWISAVGCGLLYIAGTCAILILKKPAQVSQVTGTVQAAFAAATQLSLPAFSVMFVLLISVGGLGSLGSWIAGNTRVPFAIGLDHYFPAMFARLHPRWGTPHISILSQAAITSLLLLVSQAGETLTGAYQILLDMSIITTFLPYVYIFASAWKFGQPIAAGAGLVISGLAIVLSAIPPPEASSWKIFELKVIGGCILLAYLGRIVFVQSKART